jgi:hypothetical protein
LNAGDLHFNTTSNTLKVYNGSAWQDAAIDSSGFVQTTGDTMTGNLSMGDNVKAIFGAGSDLQIYHDSASGQSIIHENGPSVLKIRATDFRISNADNTADYLSANNGAEVSIRYSGAVKLATSSSGVDITGVLSSDGLNVSAASPNIDVTDTGTSHASQDFLTNSGTVRATIGVERSTGGGLFVGSSPYAAVFGTASSGVTQFATNNNVRMTLDSSGRLLIGNTDGSYASANADNIVIGDRTSSDESGITFGSTVASSLRFADSGTSQRGLIQYVHNDTVNTDYMNFYTAGTERMRIDSSGTTSFHGISGRATGSTGHLSISEQTYNRSYLESATTTTSSINLMAFINPNGAIGSISVSGSSTAFNTSSDYRLKENVVEMTGATDRVKQLEPKRFNFIADADTTVDGFLAHEVQSVVPEAITGTHNEVDADGNPVYQGIDQSKLVPLLVATIQELEARITALENA